MRRRAERPTLDALLRVVEQLQGVPMPASALESQILPARLPGYVPVLLDQLGAAGELVWAGAGALGHNDGWIVLALAEKAALLLPDPPPLDPSPLAQRLLDVLAGGGALFFRQLAEAVRAGDDAELLLALWDLVLGGPRHQRHPGSAARDAAPARDRAARRAPAPARRVRRASGRPPAPDAGAWFRRARPTRRAGCTPPPSSC